jgi:hypothetical protein
MANQARVSCSYKYPVCEESGECKEKKRKYEKSE